MNSVNRTFMKQAICLTAAVLLTTCAANPVKAGDTTPADKLGWQLAVHAYTFKEYPIYEAIDK